MVYFEVTLLDQPDFGCVHILVVVRKGIGRVRYGSLSTRIDRHALGSVVGRLGLNGSAAGPKLWQVEVTYMSICLGRHVDSGRYGPPRTDFRSLLASAPLSDTSRGSYPSGGLAVAMSRDGIAGVQSGE